jgi:hypothetical protein
MKTIATTRTAWTRRMIALAVLLTTAMLAMTLGSGRASAAIATEDMAYNGKAQHTRFFFDQGFQADLPDFLPNRVDGRIKVRVALETTTRATLKPNTHFSADRNSTMGRGSSLNVSLTNTTFDGAGDEFVVTTTPALHIIADVEPDNGDAFECQPSAFVPGSQIPSGALTKTGDGDAWCVNLTITADMLPGLDLPKDFILIQQSLAMPQSGVRNFHEEEELFRVPVCKMISRLVPVLGFLGDHCRIRVVGTADAQLLVDNNTTDGLRATGELEVRTFDDNGEGQQTIVGGQQSFYFPNSAAVSKSYTLPCDAIPGSNVTYRVKNNRYSARVRKVELGVKLYFHVDVLGDIASVDLGNLIGRIDLLEGNTLTVNAAGPNEYVHIGSVASTSTATCSAGTPNLAMDIWYNDSTVYTNSTQTWMVRVKNTGGTATGQFSTTFNVPTAYKTVTVDTTGSGWTCSVSGRTVTCNRAGTVAANDFSPTFKVKAQQLTCGSTTTATTTGTFNGTTTIMAANDGGVQMSCQSDPDAISTNPKPCYPTASDPCDEP